MMRTMRAGAKWIMGVVAVSFVGWMVFEVGMDMTGRQAGGTTDELARINGRKIDAQTFYTAVRNAQEQQRQQGIIIYTLDDQRLLEEQVLEQMVQQVILQAEYARRGITVTDEEIRDAAQNSPLPEMFSIPQFQTEGQFDLAKYQRYLQSQTDLGFMLALEARYREELPRVKLFERATADVYLPDSKLWQIFQDRNDSAATKLMTILPAARIRDDAVDLSESEIEAHYREHRDDYHRPARAYLSFVSLSRLPNAADTIAAQVRAEQLLSELRDGADFADVARRESADSASRVQGGDLGNVPRVRFDTTFTSAAEALQPGQLSEPVLTQFGYHIIKLEASSTDSLHAHHILVPVELAGDHLRTVESRADSLDLYAAEQEDPAALDSTAAALRLAVAAAPPLVEDRSMRIGNVVVPDVGVWAFEAIEGDVSHVIEASEAYYVFRLDRREEAGVPPLEEIAVQVRFDALNAKKWEEAVALARKVRADLDRGMDFNAAAVKNALRPVVTEPFTRAFPAPPLRAAPDVVGAVFGLEVGERSGAIQTDEAIFFVEPTAKFPADSAVFVEQLDVFREQMLNEARQVRWQLVLSELRASADVVDNRQEIARRLRELPELPFPQTNPLGF